MTERSEPPAQPALAQGALEQDSATSALGALPGLATGSHGAQGHARSSPARAGSAASATFRPGSDPARAAVPVKLVWHDPVTGEELTLKLEACRELIEGLKQEGFESSESGDGEGGDSAAA